MRETPVGSGDQALPESEGEALNPGSRDTYQLQPSSQATHLSGPQFPSNTMGILPAWQVCCDTRVSTPWSPSPHPLVSHTEAKVNPAWPLFSPGVWLPVLHWHLIPHWPRWRGSHFPLARWVLATLAFLLLLKRAVMLPTSGPAHMLLPLPSCSPTLPWCHPFPGRLLCTIWIPAKTREVLPTHPW